MARGDSHRSGEAPGPPASTPGHPAGGVDSQPGTGRQTDLEQGTTIGEYTIEGKLGQGGMASVYAATHSVIGKKAAIKIISPWLCSDAVSLERFIQEARAVNRIGHQNIVDVFSFGTLADGRSYFIMEWLQGETLAARLARRPLTLSETASILTQVCAALEAAHEKGIVHRDLKPANVFLVPGRSGRRELVKLLDFGIAKLTGESDIRLLHTRTDVILGTPCYMSPEQARSKNVDARTDVYSLGVMMYEMLVGKLPYNADNVIDLVHLQLTELPPLPRASHPELPATIEQLILSMLDKDPERRPQLAAVREKLGEARRGTAGPAATTMMAPDAALTETTPLKKGARASTGEQAAQRDEPPTRIGPPTPAGMAGVPTPKTGRRIGLWLTLLVGTGATLVIVLYVWRRGPTTQHEREAVSSPMATLAPKAAPTSGPTPTVPPATPVAPPVVTPFEPPAQPTQPSQEEAPEPATLVISVNPPATIKLDGNPVGESVTTTEISIEKMGWHRLVASAHGRQSVTRKFEATPGKKIPIKLELADRPAPAPQQPPPQHKNLNYVLDPSGKKR
jgi:serine/threonine-protein kinase